MNIVSNNNNENNSNNGNNDNSGNINIANLNSDHSNMQMAMAGRSAGRDRRRAGPDRAGAVQEAGLLWVRLWTALPSLPARCHPGAVCLAARAAAQLPADPTGALSRLNLLLGRGLELHLAGQRGRVARALRQGRAGCCGHLLQCN